jgi:hypothetical protein
MLMFIAFSALAAYALGASIVALRNDGFHRVRTDYSRLL